MYKQVGYMKNGVGDYYYDTLENVCEKLERNEKYITGLCLGKDSWKGLVELSHDEWIKFGLVLKNNLNITRVDMYL